MNNYFNMRVHQMIRARHIAALIHWSKFNWLEAEHGGAIKLFV